MDAVAEAVATKFDCSGCTSATRGAKYLKFVFVWECCCCCCCLGGSSNCVGRDGDDDEDESDDEDVDDVKDDDEMGAVLLLELPAFK